MNLKLHLLFVFVIVILTHKIIAEESDPSPCLLPVKIGHCRAAIPRYAYNSTSEQCEQFKYSGCHGNANNFENIAKCEETCKPAE
ncbi:PREDICTED: PI-actitoxin-Afv2a-like [Cyphomyrmex costatus]|uniref:PI-actitoxin-Afv2a-like n=1 Tax=Cyphomyrmex costatus TaxID=456900 RepID=UPI0008522DF6|nr:PREDICTED: PI-actitoxin-Afv2a-like [Cyphomyrmex costatus]